MGVYLIADASPILSTTLWYVWITTKVLMGLGLVIFVHELGHFLVAKACGVKCEKFYLGFDVPIKIGPLALPRTLGKFRWGETEYGVGIIPLGGYVKMLGQDDNPANAQREAERIRVKKASADETFGVDSEPAGDEEFELDPRSFPAKSVPQRMAIISAGVVMNLIFAVIFAAIAYRVGVKHEPCEIGGTSPGFPAWTDNLPIGWNIVQIGKSGAESDHLRFVWDLKQQIALRGLGEDPTPIDLKLKSPAGEEKWISILPSDRLVKLEVADFATIGVRPTDSTTLSSIVPVIPHMSAATASPAFADGDRIIGLDGEHFSTGRANQLGELPADDVEAALAAHVSESLKFLVERKSDVREGQTATETVEITVPPNPLRRIGVDMQIGRLEAIRSDSPAAAAGFLPGDLIQRMDGQPIGDPVLLPQRLARLIGKDVTFQIDRVVDNNHNTIELVVRPEAHYQYAPAFGPGSLVAVESIGIAYPVQNAVVAVEPGSPAAKAGIQAGDVLVSAQFKATTDDAKQLAKKLFRRSFNEPIEFDARQMNWPYVADYLQLVPEGTDLELSYLRAERKMTAVLKPQTSTEWFYVDRGIRFEPLERIHTATSWSDAWHLGLRETKEKLLQVFNFLGKLVTFRISPKTLGGPLMIAAAAGSEASQGIPRLLLFLTFLSANLAILNFLPIPALDGGHMMFLAAEAVTGKPVDERLQGTLTLIGVVCLLGLMVFVFANDIGRLFL